MSNKSINKTKKQIGRQSIKMADIFVSVVVAFRGSTSDEIDFAEYCRDLNKLLYKRYSNFEMIIVDNGRRGDEIIEITRLLSELPCMRIIRLSQNYSHDVAVMAGLESSIGDYTVITDPAHDYVEDIPRIVEENAKHDIIQGVLKAQKGKQAVKMTAPRRVFYWYSRKYMHVDVPTNSTYFMAFSRRAIAALTASSRYDSHIRHMAKIIGYSYTEYPYETRINPVRSRSLKVGAIEALDIVSSYSVHPLRLMSWVGFMASILSIIYALYVIYITLTKSNVAEGWTTMSLQISGMFFILFLLMIILAEYIGKILTQVRRDARYHVLDELTSTVSLADTERKNITS